MHKILTKAAMLRTIIGARKEICLPEKSEVGCRKVNLRLPEKSNSNIYDKKADSSGELFVFLYILLSL